MGESAERTDQKVPLIMSPWSKQHLHARWTATSATASLGMAVVQCNPIQIMHVNHKDYFIIFAFFQKYFKDWHSL